jgi:hypothetical protein
MLMLGEFDVMVEHWLRNAMDRGFPPNGYEPLQLALIPILLRTRHQYYEEAAKRIDRQIEETWRQTSKQHETLEQFRNSDFAKGIWRHDSPSWWGLNDIIGYIDIRINLMERAIELNLFLTSKRVSRSLVKKEFVLKASKKVMLGAFLKGGSLEDAVRQKLLMLAKDSRVAKYHVSCEHFLAVLPYIDLAGLTRTQISKFCDGAEGNEA